MREQRKILLIGKVFCSPTQVESVIAWNEWFPSKKMFPIWTMSWTPPHLHEHCIPSINSLSPSLIGPGQSSSLCWAGATESIILLWLWWCGCLINDTTNNCNAVTSPLIIPTDTAGGQLSADCLRRLGLH